MKRIIIYIGILALLLQAPVKGTDINMLKPVEVILVYREKNDIVIETDTGDWGRGGDVSAALNNLKETTPGYVYMDTAQYLIVTEKTMEAVDEIRPVLKRSVQICCTQEDIDLAVAAKFLPAQGELPQLKDWKIGEEMPKLICVEKRLKLS